MGFFKLEKIGKKQEHGTPAETVGPVGPQHSHTTSMGSGMFPYPNAGGLGTNPFGSAATSNNGSRSVSPDTAREQWKERQSAIGLVKNQVMINYLFQQQSNNGWRSEKCGSHEGVMLRVTRETYLSHPPEMIDTPLADSLRSLNVQSAMTIYSPVIKSYLDNFPNSTELPLLNGLAVQISKNIETLATARTHQFAAVVASESLLIVWDDDAVNMLSRAKTIEWELMQLLWNSNPFEQKRGSRFNSKIDLALNEKEVGSDESEIDVENEGIAPRPTIFINTVLVSISLACIIATLGLGLRQLVIELLIDSGAATQQGSPYIRFAFLALTPVWMFFGMFFFNVLVTNIAEIIGPIAQMNINSKHYSAKTVPRITRNLPHVTIQCPVYKESLEEVIQPTIVSIKKAISTYELQGGSANIFVNDDGLQLISEEEREKRIGFYADNNIGWVARPGHGVNGFFRKGKFKKASNMNFAMDISCKLEDKLLELERGDHWTSTDEAEATAWALDEVIKEGGEIAWADGNVRLGDYILIIDSDTRVPVDCLLDAVSELEISPEVAILQFSSGVMNVTTSYFEKGITFFTNLVYSAIRYGVSNGDVAPFVGHNAILRWSALQDVAEIEDGHIKFWSESHVSEDFDMALRLQIKGYITRLAAWANDGFQEGVSLTVYDELARWQKYAYGCNELMFHPIRFWFVRGPFTPLFRRFLGSNMPVASKVNIISYIGTYYAIGAAWIMTVVNYIIIGWYKGYIDKYYVNSWNIWITLVIVFNGLGNVALAVLRYRNGEKAFMSALIENFKWLFLLFIFLGGISIHVSEALLAHMVCHTPHPLDCFSTNIAP
jgi:cellulose synthase/poly-beta-1,6-N-acetylglucosamine synthase-like glycosyltransferase